MRKIFVSWPGYSPDDAETGARLISAGYELLLHPKLGARRDDELIALMQDAVAAIVSTDPFTRRAIESNAKLKLIARIGVGTDSIDRAAATSRGVAISITPGMNAETVADQTLAMILALLRKVVDQDRSVKAGRWDRVGPATPYELSGKQVGVVGGGIIGNAVVKRLLAFNCRVQVYDVAPVAIPGAERAVSLDAMLREADIVTLHAPLVPDTQHLVNEARLALLKKTAILINTSRGGLVKQDAVFDALRTGRLGGAGLDVFEEEPPPKDLIADVPNLLCSAHMGGLSYESIRRMTVSATDTVLKVLSGEVPDTVINPEALRGEAVRHAD